MYVSVSLYVNVPLMEVKNRTVLLRELPAGKVVELTELETKVDEPAEELVFEVLVVLREISAPEKVVEDVTWPVVDIVDELVALVDVDPMDVVSLPLLEIEPEV